MRAIYRFGVAGLIAVFVMLPLPETVIAFGRVRSFAFSAVLIASLFASLAQLAGEYWVMGQAGQQVEPYARSAWAWFRTTIVAGQAACDRRLLETGGYIAMVLMTLNPFPFLPGRTVASGIWRGARLPYSMFVIVGCTVLKLSVVCWLAYSIGR